MPRGVSVHIGLNHVDSGHYDGWSGDLVACEADAQAMKAIAESRQLTPTVLLTQQATADAVIAAIRNAASQLQTDDFFFLTYSGHGGEVPDTNSDEENDKSDETWVLYDRQLVDDELYALWGEFRPGVRIFVLSDSCHSGTATRGLDEPGVPHVLPQAEAGEPKPRTKELPRDVQRATYEAHKDLYDGIQKVIPSGETVDVAARVILISGCQDNQLSRDGDVNGLFTEKLLATWSNGAWTGDYSLFATAIRSLMPSDQTPNYFAVGAANDGFERQTPLTI
jgi:hypothetical protein